MHSMGIHSALAIKRNRKRRDEARRSKERRYSTHSTESGITSPHMGSMHSLERKRKLGPSLHADHTVTSIGMLHIGVVFIVVGFFLLIAGLMPNDISNWTPVFTGGWFNELVLSGSFAFAIGVFLIILNKIIAKKEDDDLSDYVARQLTRTKSGQRLVRDAETGGLSTKQEMRHNRQNGDVIDNEDILTPVHTPPGVDKMNENHHLELIVEEECSEKGEEESRCMNKETNGDDSGSPSSPSETRELLAQAERYFNMVQK